MRSWRLSLVLVALVVGIAADASAQNSSSPGGKAVVPEKGTPTVQKVRPSHPDFGLVDDHYVRIGGSEFVTDGAAAKGYTNTWNPGSNTNWRGYFFDNTVFQHAYGWVHAPGGAVLDYVELDYCNNDATNDLVLNVYDCGFHGDCGASPIVTLTGSATTGCSDRSTSSVVVPVVDNFLHEYLLDVVFPTGGPTNGDINLAGAIVGWRYQVSPAPATATFPDVPTSDFGFQYVEALVASGVTAGCGGGNYCPDNPLTRRQMAIFLSKALGLYWGGF